MSAMLVAAIALLVAVGFGAALDACPGVGGPMRLMAPVESRYGEMAPVDSRYGRGSAKSLSPFPSSPHVAGSARASGVVSQCGAETLTRRRQPPGAATF